METSGYFVSKQCFFFSYKIVSSVIKLVDSALLQK
jgi:hypothetical protein